jgi:hypothetical protein
MSLRYKVANAMRTNESPPAETMPAGYCELCRQVSEVGTEFALRVALVEFPSLTEKVSHKTAFDQNFSCRDTVSQKRALKNT